MGQLGQSTQHNAAASEELAATAEQMSGQAAQLQQMMSFFKDGYSQGESHFDSHYAQLMPAQPRSLPSQSQSRLRSERPAPQRAMSFGGVSMHDPLAIDESSFTKY